MENAPEILSNSTGGLRYDEGSEQDSVIVIPALLSLSTLVVVGIILWKSISSRWNKFNTVNRSPGERIGDWAINSAAIYENDPGIPVSELQRWELPHGWKIEDRVSICPGQFGPISGAFLRKANERQRVIMKELSGTCSPGEVQDFLDVMRFYSQVCDHEHLVKLLWCRTSGSPISIFLKAMNPGNLLHFLWRSREVGLADKEPLYKITEKKVYSMAIQVASALEYLTGTHDLVHGNVAACNVLVDEEARIRLCGLGIAAIVHRTGTVPARRTAQFPLKWQAPERVNQGVVTDKGDVWSFGILLYEMVTLGAPPYPDLTPSQVLPRLEKGKRIEHPAQCGQGLYQLMVNCWHWNPCDRPGFTEVIKWLNKHTEEADGLTPLGPAEMIRDSDYRRLAGVPI